MTDELSDDFRAFLQVEFTKRCKKNPRYSLRAYAVSLQEDPSSLSQFLRGKRKMSAKKMRNIALKLGINSTHFKKYVLSNSSSEYKKIASDHFMLLSNWYHLAICELCQTVDFVHEHKWIASKLGINIVEVKAAIDRLIRLNWLKINNDKLEFCGGDITTIDSDINLSALSQLQKQMLEKASDAMSVVPLSKRSQSGMTMSISSQKLEQANVMITKFRRKLCHFLEDSEQKDDVYHLSISLFPLTKY